MENLNTNQNKLFKILITLASLLLVLLFVIGLILTFSHKSLLRQQSHLQNKNNQIEDDISELEKDNEFLSYNEDDGEIIIKH